MWHILPDAWQMCFLSAFFSTVYNSFEFLLTDCSDSVCATLFSDVSFEGASLDISATPELTWVGPDWNDKAKSAKVTRGCFFKGYANNPMQHPSNPAYDFTLQSDLASLPCQSGGEMLSSFTCDCFGKKFILWQNYYDSFPVTLNKIPVYARHCPED